MQEYAHPSGVRIPDGDISGWIIGPHIVFAALLIGAFAVFVWRCFQKASLWDVPGWIALTVIAWHLMKWVAANFLNADAQFGLYAVLMFVLVFVAVNVAICRRVNNKRFTQSFVFVEFVGFVVLLVLPAIQQAKEAPRRTQCKNNLKQIGLALRNYHDAYLTFPYAGGVTPDAGQVCSWRVAIAVYMEAIPWYTWYHLNETWDSAHNSQYQDKCPVAYHCPSHPTDNHFTAYAMLTGPGTVGGDGLTATKLGDITDGTSQTLMIVEACGREIIWTEPRDVEVTDESLGVNLPGDRPGHSRGILSSHHVGGAHGLLADGTVRFFAETMDKTVLKALTTINGGEEVPEF